jgi:hypothetical protein
MDTLTHRAVVAYEAKYRSAAKQGPVAQALAAFDLVQWLLESGRLRRADEIAVAMWQHALESLHLSEGMPVQEVVQLVDAAALMLVELRTVTEGTTGVRRTLDDLVALHERFRERLAVFNRHSIVPVAGPEGPVDRKELLRGRASALEALLAGDPAKALRIVKRALESWAADPRGSAYHVKARLLAAYCLHHLGRDSTCRELLEELRDERAAREWQSLGCEIGDLHARTQVGSGTEHAALDALEALLDSASHAGLALRCTDLMCTRAELLAASGDRAGAQTAIRHALLGGCDDEACAQRWPEAHLFPSPSEEGYRTAFLRMRPLTSAGMDETAALLDKVLLRTLPPNVPTRSKYCGRRMPRRLELRGRPAAHRRSQPQALGPSPGGYTASDGAIATRQLGRSRASRLGADRGAIPDSG